MSLGEENTPLVNFIEIDFVYDLDSQRTVDFAPSLVLTDMSQLLERHVDLVVEVAHPRAIREFAPDICFRSRG